MVISKISKILCYINSLNDYGKSLTSFILPLTDQVQQSIITEIFNKNVC
ncbi:hypothetical protein pb186bvf_020478 [Paramecium bursaria]